MDYFDYVGLTCVFILVTLGKIASFPLYLLGRILKALGLLDWILKEVD